MTLLSAPLPVPLLVLLATVLWFVVTSLIAWLRFWQDKRFARADLRRIPEAKLLRIAMIGGWPGAKLAQRHFRHKTRKEPFRTQLNICALPALVILATCLMLAWSTIGRETRLTGLFGPMGEPQNETARPMPRRFGPGS